MAVVQVCNRTNSKTITTVKKIVTTTTTTITCTKQNFIPITNTIPRPYF